MGKILKKEELLFLFNNGDKPSGMDFEALIDFADNTLSWIAHEVPGGGDRPMTVDLNEFLNFSIQYSEVHLIIHQTLGTYLCKINKEGSYGAVPTATEEGIGAYTRSVTEADFIHIGPSPDIINDNSKDNTHTTFSSRYITNTFYTKEDTDDMYLSREHPNVIIDKDASINSFSTIKATNLINDITYNDSYLELHFGPDGGEEIKPVLITPNVNTYKLDVPCNAAYSIVSDFNRMKPIYRQFKKGDVVFLEYDMASQKDEDGNLVYGKNTYVITKEFPYEVDEDNGFKLSDESSDVLQLNTLTKEYLKYNYYDTGQIDTRLVNLASGIKGTIPTYESLVTTILAPKSGEQWIVENYFATVDYIPVDTNGIEVSGTRGVFIYQGSWIFIYTQAYDHDHNNLYYTKDISDNKYATKTNVQTTYLDKVTTAIQDVVAPVRLGTTDSLNVGVSLLANSAVQASEFIGSGKKLTNYATWSETLAGTATDLIVAPFNLKKLFTAELNNYLPLSGGNMSGHLSIRGDDDGLYDLTIGNGSGSNTNSALFDMHVGGTLAIKYSGGGVTTIQSLNSSRGVQFVNPEEDIMMSVTEIGIGIGGGHRVGFPLKVHGNADIDGTVVGSDPILENHLATKRYVDGVGRKASIQETIGSGGAIGFAIAKRVQSNYGPIGWDALDVSISNVPATTKEYGATGANSAAFGFLNLAQGTGSVVSGWESRAYAKNSVAMGNHCITGDPDEEIDGGVALGYYAEATGIYSFATVNTAIASGRSSAAIGHNVLAEGDFSFAAGKDSQALGWNSTVFGHNNIASGQSSFVGGELSNAMAKSSFAYGREVRASGIYSCAIGYGNKASGYSSMAVGRGTEAKSTGSMAFGYQTKAIGAFAMSAGRYSQATQSSSFSFGDNTVASGIRSMSTGYINIASGTSSFSCGDHNTSNGFSSFTTGGYNTAEWDYSSAFGYRSKAGTFTGMAIGKYNVGYDHGAFEVGWGTSDSLRENLFTVSTNGTIHAHLATHAKIAAASSDVLITKEYFDANVGQQQRVVELQDDINLMQTRHDALEAKIAALEIIIDNIR